MHYSFHTHIDPQAMDQFVITSNQNSLFQCSPWTKIKTSWDSLLTGVTDDMGTLVATALVLIRKMPLGTTLFYVPRGPVMDYSNSELVEFMLEQLETLAREHHAIALRFDPSVLSRKYSYKERSEDHPYQNQQVIDLLKSCGAVHRGFTVRIEESTQPRFNAEMDVTQDYREHLEHKTLKCIRASEHKGIEVLQGPEYLHDFATAMHYTEVRKKVALRNEDYFRNMMEVYGDHSICMVSILNFPRQIERLNASIAEHQAKLAGPLSKKEKTQETQSLANDQKELEKLQEDYKREQQDQVITCGILAVYNEGLMELLYMGNNPDYLRMYSSYLLYAKCLDICAEKGISHCSFGGVEGTLDDGLTLFKSNWLMNVEEYIGEFNIILNPLMYKAFDELYPKLLKKAAQLRGKEN
ncbi:MAG: aminoacyltransferase [Solobacterium sp.]|jgi:serine/alanine adding enzyme|nr:aminoacyltransferase [Solobacterium sp.]MCH4223008.1 aminoacyltransferase [Solobacterium sp.]